MINVLVVEDSRVIRDYLVYVLGSDPELRISDAVCSGEEALASVEKHRPDVILMDIHLPGIDGFETTRRIMSSDPVPIVICTSTARFDQMHTAMQALEAGALTVIKKPGGFGDPVVLRLKRNLAYWNIYRPTSGHVNAEFNLDARLGVAVFDP